MQEQLECGTTFLFPKLHFYGHYLFWRECLNLVFQDKYAKSKNSKKGNLPQDFDFNYTEL